MNSHLPDHANAIKGALVNAREVCERLGLIDGRGSFQRQASGLTIRCPKHGGVSCSVTRGPDGTLRINCFGCNDFSGDVLTLIAAVRGLDTHRDFRTVLLEGAKLAGLWSIVDELERAGKGKVSRSEGRGRAPDPPRPAPKPAPPELPTLDVDTFDRVATALLEASPLDAQPDVCAYLKERRMQPRQGCSLGGAPGTLGARPAPRTPHREVRGRGTRAQRASAAPW